MQDQIALSKAVEGDRRPALRPLQGRLRRPPHDHAAAIDLSRTDNGLSPRAGLIWTPTAASDLLRQLQLRVPAVRRSSSSLATTTADLDPEKAQQLRDRRALGPASETDAVARALFRTDRDDVRVDGSGEPGLLREDAASSAARASEIGLQGEVTRDWQVFGGYAYLDGRVTKPISTGTTAPSASDRPGRQQDRPGARAHVLCSGTRSISAAGWGVGLGLIYQDELVHLVQQHGDAAVVHARGRRGLLRRSATARRGSRSTSRTCSTRSTTRPSDGDNNISPGRHSTARLTLLAASERLTGGFRRACAVEHASSRWRPSRPRRRRWPE